MSNDIVVKKLITTILIFLSIHGFSQRIEKLTSILTGENIEITYDLFDDHGRTFDLQLYSSHNNYSTPLQFVTGDIGKEIATGTSKKVVWEAKKELGEYKGEIYLEIRGIFTPPFVRILTPNAGDKFKPGKALEIQWFTEISGNMGIDLYRNGTKVSTITSAGNSGKYTWAVNKGTTKGDYYLVFRSNAKPGKTVESAQFTISKGIPIWAVVAGVAVIGGLVGIVMSGGQDPGPATTDDPTDTNSDIPDPIKPGGG